MKENAASAHTLVEALKGVRIDARVKGGGVHWQVDVGPVGTRAMVVHCFWYERTISGLLLGMNPSNTGSPLRSAQVPRVGAEYFVIVQEDGRRVAGALELVEGTLAAYPIRPFFGSAPHHELPLLSECFSRQGSTLRPSLEQRGAWYRLFVAGGSRRCEVSDRCVTFTEASRRLALAYTSLDEVVHGIRRYLEDDASFDDLVADPHATLRLRA